MVKSANNCRTTMSSSAAADIVASSPQSTQDAVGASQSPRVPYDAHAQAEVMNVRAAAHTVVPPHMEEESKAMPGGSLIFQRGSPVQDKLQAAGPLKAGWQENKWTSIAQVALRSLSITVEVTEPHTPSLWRAFKRPFSKQHRTSLGVLQDITLTLEPGSSTIIIAPPGAGATVLLRTIAGLYSPDDNTSVLYNGVSRKALLASKTDIRQFTAYCGEADVHEPLLTVRETLQIAADLAGKEAGANAVGKPCDYAGVQGIMKEFGIDVAADTIVGNALFRGISGGQKRRTSLAEAFLMEPKVLCLDQPTAGLDALTAKDIMHYGCAWAKCRGSVLIAAIQGAGPELFMQFDNVLLLSEGKLLYHGPTREVDSYLAARGMPRPSYMDIADWCLEVVSSPALAREQAIEESSEAQDGRPLAELTVESLAKVWTQHADVAKPIEASGAPLHLRRPAPLHRQASILIRRQFKLSMRNWLFILLRLANCILMAAILGTVFLDAPSNDFALKFSLALFAVTFIAFINNAEIPIALLSRAVVYKQTNYAQYSEAAYTLSVMVAHVPLTLLSDLLFAAILYYIAGYQSAASRFFFFYLVIISQDFLISVLYRTMSYWTPTQEIAMTAGSAFTAAGLATGGFFVIRSALPKWMVWLLYISPFWWCVTAIANNEYSAPAFDAPFSPTNPTRTGSVYLAAFDYPEGKAWQWGAIVFLLGLYVLVGFTLQPWVLAKVRRDYRPGARRSGDMDTSTDETSAHIGLLLGNSETSQQIAFPRITLYLHNIGYSVMLKKKVVRPLLREVSGIMLPGQMTALMGASGAGKTTLLDCISFRKTTGTITGDLMLNGLKANKKLVLALSGYVQQEDILPPFSTVQEVLRFSAEVRLPSSIPASEKDRLVDGAIALLKLERLRDRTIPTLSRGEQKVVSIAQELVSNPSIMFLDEPTTGQDAKSSALIIRAMRRIADSGRTVICTIHQPSPSVFFSFDNLLLLAPGGYLVYCGPLGHHASELQAYLENLPGAPKLPAHVNPAVWMLDVVNGQMDAPSEPQETPSLAQNVAGHVPGDNSVHAMVRASDDSGGADDRDNAGESAPGQVSATSPVADRQEPGSKDAGPAQSAYSLAQTFRNSEAGVALAQGAQGSNLQGSDAAVEHEALARFAVQPSQAVRFRSLLGRSWKDYNRDTGYNVSRIIVVIFLALFFGCVYYKVDQTTFSGLQSAFGALLAAPGFLGVLLFTTAMPHMFHARDVVYRESTSGFYSRALAVAALLIVEIPYVAFFSIIFVSIFYFMIGYIATAGKFWAFTLVTFFVALTYQYAGLMLAGIFPNIVVAQVVGGMTLSVYFLFAGVFISPRYIIKYWKWFYYIDFESWAVRMLAMDQFYCTGASCDSIVIPTPTSTVTVTQYEFVSTQLEFTSASKWKAFGALVGFCAFYGLVTVAVFRLINHLKREARNVLLQQTNVRPHTVRLMASNRVEAVREDEAGRCPCKAVGTSTTSLQRKDQDTTSPSLGPLR